LIAATKENQAVNTDEFCVHSRSLPEGHSGELVSFSRQQVGWQWMSFTAVRLAPEGTWSAGSENEESAVVLLGGRCWADWGDGRRYIGTRKNVFSGLPYTVYLPAGSSAEFQAEGECELAICSVPSRANLSPRLITPEEVVVSLRGGGNASRQIVDIMPPDFPADKLMLVEVYTPGGNWSSFPPHKHDVHSPPAEVDLDEIYYYRMELPAAFAQQRLYTKDSRRDITLTVHDGDVVLVRDGYHPVVAGHGYDVYYLNCLAGSARSLANTEDVDHVWVRTTWKDADPRLPLVEGL
jgi:5-deoxy-glucuronate isomerase